MSADSANSITARLLLEIPRRFTGCRVWRANVLVARTGDRIVRAGLPGQADLSGISADGRRIEVEVKAGRDRLSPIQAAFGEMIAARGGVYVVARSVEQAIEELAEQIEGRRV